MIGTALQLARAVLVVATLCTGMAFQSHAGCTNPARGNENESDSVASTNHEVFLFVEESPMYPGGSEELVRYFSENLIYPEKAILEQLEGEVYVRFEVKEDGSIGETQVSKSVHPYLDAEAVRVIKSMPKWLPGRFRGEAVNSWYTLPVSFNLRH